MDKNYKNALKRIQEAKQKNSTKLDLSGLELTEIPPEILDLTKLTLLNINQNRLTKVPQAIGNLTNLTELDLRSNQLTTLPEAIGKLTNLTAIDLSNNLLTTLPEAIGNLTNLTNLQLYNNQLTTFPEVIWTLTNLTLLNIFKIQLTTLPEAIGNLTKLNFLNLQGNHLTTVPEALGKLTNLTELYLNNNQLTTLPESIGKLTKLTELQLNSNQLPTVPKAIRKLTALVGLNLGDNQLTTLPEVIGKLTNLTRLLLWKNQLTNISEVVWKLTNLKKLHLSDNQLTTVPESIGKLNNLTELYLENNQLTTIPEAIGKLTNLRTLYLSGNKLTTLPESIRELTNLTDLKLYDNQFKVGTEIYELPPIEQINEILKWQRAQQAGTLQSIHEAKVIFIGESNFGKTHLIEFLEKGKIERKIKTTHGIERSQLNVPYKDKVIRLNIWDLGGQEFMRSTHQFFFSERTLYVLVTLARRERNELNHWLKLANQLGNRAPVLVVINKIDIDPHDLDRKSLQRDYPNIIGFVRTCIHDCDDGKATDTLEILEKKITAIVSDKNIMPGVFEQRPPDWFTVKKELEKLEAKGTDFITYKEFENLKFIKSLPPEERKSNLKLLSMIGAVVSFVDDPRLIDTNVINPQWIMDGVYAIINDPIVKDKAKGELHIKDLERILDKDKFPKGRHAYLLELMQKFNVCYAAKDQRDIYLIPDLFEDIEPDFEWTGDESMHFRYNYDDFPPDVFMKKFIVEMHQDIQDEKRWRSGVFISNGSCQAKVYQAYRKNFIHVEIQGNEMERRSYLYTIRDSFRKLHKPFPDMNIREQVTYKEVWLNYITLEKLEKQNKPYYHVDLEEDLPVTDILNGYTSLHERKGTLQIIEIFLASSSELKAERDQFKNFINDENNSLIGKGIFIKLHRWEESIDAMSQTRLQDEYNNVVKHSDIFVSLFFTKVGMYTLEEFETAFGQFKKTGKPLVYTYFKNASINTEEITDEIQSLLDFKKNLKDLGHYRTVYKNIDDLKLQFKIQLEMVLPNL